MEVNAVASELLTVSAARVKYCHVVLLIVLALVSGTPNCSEKPGSLATRRPFKVKPKLTH